MYIQISRIANGFLISGLPRPAGGPGGQVFYPSWESVLEALTKNPPPPRVDLLQEED